MRLSGAGTIPEPADTTVRANTKTKGATTTRAAPEIYFDLKGPTTPAPGPSSPADRNGDGNGAASHPPLMAGIETC